MKPFLNILLISAIVFFFGSAVVFGWTQGLIGILMSPLLGMFGWYFFVPLFFFVSVLWWGHRYRGRSWMYNLGFILASTLTSLGFSFLVSGTNPKSSPDLVEALRLAFAAAGAISAFLVLVLKGRTLNGGTSSKRCERI